MWSALFFLVSFVHWRAIDARHAGEWQQRRYANSTRRVDALMRPSSTNAALGQYIAAGLDNNDSTSRPTRSSSIVVSTGRSSPTSWNTKTSITSYSSFDTVRTTTGQPSVSVSNIPTERNQTLGNATNIDQCWSDWTQYWQASQNASRSYTTIATTYVGDIVSDTLFWSTFPWTTTETEMNGNFPTRTLVTTYTRTSEVVSSITEGTGTVTDHLVTRVSANITPPPCALPSVVPQCQSSWQAYADEFTYEAPACTQANVTGSACNHFVSEWYSAQFVPQNGDLGWAFSGKPGLQFSTITLDGTTTTSGFWPTTSQVAPGCTIGCMSCRISGSRVQLLYWPPATSAVRNGTSNTATANGTLSAAPARNSRIVTAVTNGVTLTSPTVYVSFDRLQASDSCSVLGSTISNTIIAITDTASLSSLYGWGHYIGIMETASFNFTDLYVTPVPDSIYRSQPRCASSSERIQYSCLQWGTTGPAICSTALHNSMVCDRTLPYEPVLSIPPEVRNLQPEWANCIGGLDGVYDPPSAIQPQVSAAEIITPTWPGSSTAQTTSAEPIVSMTAAAPSPTISGALPPTQAVASAVAISTPGSPEVQDPSNAGQSSPVLETAGAADSSSTNALDVLTQAQAALSSSLAAAQGASQGAEDPRTSTSTPQAVEASAGGAAVTVGGQTISLGASGVIVDGSSVAFSQADPVSSKPPAAVFTVGSDVITAQQSQPVVVNHSTFSTGGAAVTISGQTISLGSSAIVVDGTTAAFSHEIPAPASTPIAIIPLGSSSMLTVEQGKPVVFGSSTLSVGGAAITIGSQAISLAPSGIVVDGSSAAFTQPTNIPAAVLTLGLSTITAQQGRPLVIGSSTLTADNDPIVVGSQTISLGPSGIVVDGSSVPYTQSFHFDPTQAPAAVVTLGSETLTIQQSQPVVLGGTTLSIGGTPVTIDGQIVSIGSSGIIINGNSAAFATETAAPIAVFTIGSQTITAHQGQPLTLSPAQPSDTAITFTGHDHATNIAVQSGSEIIILNPSTTATLTSGQNAVIGSETLSFGSGGLVAGTSTLSMATPAVTTWTAPNGAAYTALAQGSNIVVAGAGSTVTLSDGAAATLPGETISALSNGDGLVVDGSRTIELPEETSTAASLPAFTRLGNTTSATTTSPGRGSGTPEMPSTTAGSATATTHTSAGTIFEPQLWTAWLVAVWPLIFAIR